MNISLHALQVKQGNKKYRYLILLIWACSWRGIAYLSFIYEQNGCDKDL